MSCFVYRFYFDDKYVDAGTCLKRWEDAPQELCGNFLSETLRNYMPIYSTLYKNNGLLNVPVLVRKFDDGGPFTARVIAALAQQYNDDAIATSLSFGKKAYVGVINRIVEPFVKNVVVPRLYSPPPVPTISSPLTYIPHRPYIRQMSPVVYPQVVSRFSPLFRGGGFPPVLIVANRGSTPYSPVNIKFQDSTINIVPHPKKITITDKSKKPIDVSYFYAQEFGGLSHKSDYHFVVSKERLNDGDNEMCKDLQKKISREPKGISTSPPS